MNEPSRFEEILGRVENEPMPIKAHLELTFACGWRCGFCYNPRHYDLRGLDLHEWSRVLEGLRSLGTLSVTLTGGDPLAHPDFLAIARDARKRGLLVKVLTNGSLVTPRLARELREIRVQAVELSLHGARPETHDRTTARPGSFRQVWEAVGFLQAAGIRVVLKTVLTSENAGDLEAMADAACERGIPYVVDPMMSPRDDGDLGPLAFSASAEDMERLFSRLADKGLLRRRRRRVVGDLNCGVGWSGVAVDPEGNVFPCLQWRAGTLGNVRETPIAELWRDAPERQRAVSFSRRANTMLASMDGAVSERWFCPARAYLVTGDPLGLDDGFLREAMAVARAWRARPQESA